MPQFIFFLLLAVRKLVLVGVLVVKEVVQPIVVPVIAIVLEHVADTAPVLVKIVLERVTPVVLVPPMQDFKYN